MPRPASIPAAQASTAVDASIVIVNWNGRAHLQACLTAVAALTGVSVETILVDNGSTDGSVALVEAEFPWVRIVPLNENRGFAGGNNAGARAATGRYLVFLNNDTAVEPAWLERLVAGVDEAAGFVVMASRIVYMHDPLRIDSAGDGLLRWGGPFKWHHGGPVELARESREVFAACGCALLMPRAVFEELGGFDEDFFLSNEDVDLSYRARLRGYRVRYVADAVVLHRGSATLGHVSAFSVFHAQRNLEWMYLKNTPRAILLRTLPGHVVYNLAAAAYFARAGRLWTFLRAKAAALAGLSGVLRKRAVVQRSARATAADIWPLLEPRWLDIKRREKAFELELARGPR
jgi:N-acetylglucosaminyl-diphospho-decaprenol L-rhamnosyltransferase